MFGNPQFRPAQIPAVLRGSALVFVVGLAVTGCSGTAKDEPQPVAAALVETASPSPSLTPSTECDFEDDQQTFNEQTFFCTKGVDGALVWMDLGEHDSVIAAVAAEIAVKEAAALKVAEAKKAEEAAAAKKAADAKAADKAAAKKAADAKATADKAAASAYPNCSAAASAGAYNIPAGAPGYGPHLDRDGDGIACENSGGSGPAPVEQPAQPAQPVQPVQPAPSVYYSNCSAARAAGAAPVYVGEPGYASHLDRDGDGVGCE
jgi:hypothetical protein